MHEWFGPKLLDQNPALWGATKPTTHRGVSMRGVELPEFPWSWENYRRNCRDYRHLETITFRRREVGNTYKPSFEPADFRLRGVPDTSDKDFNFNSKPDFLNLFSSVSKSYGDIIEDKTDAYRNIILRYKGAWEWDRLYPYHIEYAKFHPNDWFFKDRRKPVRVYQPSLERQLLGDPQSTFRSEAFLEMYLNKFGAEMGWRGKAFRAVFNEGSCPASPYMETPYVFARRPIFFGQPAEMHLFDKLKPFSLKYTAPLSPYRVKPHAMSPRTVELFGRKDLFSANSFILKSKKRLGTPTHNSANPNLESF